MMPVSKPPDQARPERANRPPGTLLDRFKRRERLLIAALIAAIIVAAFPQIVFFGRSLVPTDNYNPLAASYGTIFDPGQE